MTIHTIFWYHQIIIFLLINYFYQNVVIFTSGSKGLTSLRRSIAPLSKVLYIVYYIHIDIHTPIAAEAMQGTIQHIRSNLGFSVLPKDT